MNVLAEELTPNEDATEWTVRIKQGITFHNGKDLTADDVIYTFRTVLNPKAPGSAAAGLASIDAKGMTKLDAYTVRIPCSTPFATLSESLAIPGYSDIIPVGYNPAAPVGTGPFRLQSFTPGTQSTFVRYDGYWQSGLPYLDEVVITDYGDPTSQVNALLAGQVDVVNLLSADVISVVEGQGENILISDGGGWYPFTMRVDQPPFNDVRVRQAMRLLVDRVEMNDVCQKGLGKIGNDIFSIYDPAVRPQHSPASAGHRSGQVAAEGGRSRGADRHAGHLQHRPDDDPAGDRVRAASDGRGREGQPEQRHERGILRRNYLSWTFAQDGWNTHSYLLQASLATIPGPGAENETHFDNARYNSLFNQAIRKVSEADRIPLCHEMQMIDYTEGGLIIPFFETLIDGYAKRVHGVQPCASGISFNNWDVTGYWLD